jgi:hypothetical protein
VFSYAPFLPLPLSFLADAPEERSLFFILGDGLVVSRRVTRLGLRKAGMCVKDRDEKASEHPTQDSPRLSCAQAMPL